MIPKNQIKCCPHQW